ncbi:phenylalanyl-tRNA synthetase beta subunit [Candidatus Ruthia magnifica str. Cm (Calyptogena magnifica)]|uniref:Phenylalanine--tRNA ligase beta subunit n=1 Tax=Ruthia magnifica subsp. Calyptogena magnifica TaxID=413404 RepID=A1AWT0_RUTMC|nr:phenylalanine--tRNA ligase subunit beta [Candidatus Ruthturnera calyptogenae]ABL02387.1 phenylalanyl-tRNA synthetase beta subunit [Candidatus Ruthia magnifica str. Cm (Calyptogena magnifica)]
MNILSNWLREWVNPNVTDEALAEQLTMAGLEVYGIVPIALAFKGVVVGQIISCDKHPDADKLNLCQVDVGEAENLQIICGAKNIRSGLKVIVATVGAKFPGGVKIKKTKFKGVESFGMICSESELGMAELEDDAPIGQNIKTYLNLDDHVIELDITPNRGDCFSVLGVAREVSAHYNLAFDLPEFEVFTQGDCVIGASVSDTQACPKYLTRTIIGIDNTVKTSKWMADKLVHSGQQLHSPVVDIINFVLLELGQPMHAFDLSKLTGDIKVRMAKSGEQLELLNETTLKLKEDTLVIADSDSVLAIAGVMGGMTSSIKNNSSNILLESAFFEPVFIAGKARSYGLHTESSLRFERGVDFNITELAMDRTTQLIVEICGGQASKVNACIDKNALPELKPITISQEKIKKILGLELDAKWIEQKFINLGFEISQQTNNSWTIIPPSFRFDIRIPVDLIEELARLYGYDKLPVQKLSLESNISTTSETNVDQYDIMQSLVNRGYQEVITYSFISEKYQNLISPDTKKIRLSNPISADMSIMRSSLISGLLQTVESNQRRGHTDARFFEIGLCFDGIKTDKQSNKLAAIVTGNRFDAQWSSDLQPLDFFDIKADLESLLALTNAEFSFETAQHAALQKGQTAKIILNSEQVGWIGALSPMVQKQLSLSKCYLFEIDLVSIKSRNIAQYKALSPYQQSGRDIALVLDEAVPVAELIQSVKAMQQQYFVDVNLFDVYIGGVVESGKKSVALSLTYQSLEGTLTEAQLNAKVDEVLVLMQAQYSAILR